MKRTSWVVAAAMLASVESARAGIVAQGAGTVSCTTFAKTEITELGFFHWAQGFMSGLNASDARASGRARDLSSMTPEDQQRFLRNYCKEHPLADYLQGVLELYSQLKFAKP
jgi:hypothetical protein